MRLIDADELKEHLFVGADHDKTTDDGIAKTEKEVFAFQCGWNDALKSVAQFAPTVDAVEVVRCKDCRYWDAFPTASATPYMHECSCRYPHRGTSANDYCSWAERREDETD